MIQYLGFLAPIAFVFALSALAQVASLKKQLEVLEKTVDALEKELQSNT